MLGKVTFDEQVNVLEKYCIHIFEILMALFTKLKVLKGLFSHSVVVDDRLSFTDFVD